MKTIPKTPGNPAALILSLGVLMVVADAQEKDGEKSRSRARDLGIEIGEAKPGKWNAITDVNGVKIGQVTMHEGENVHTGVTAILPHGGNLFEEKVPAAIVVGNGFGKLAGSTQVEELGNIETPILLTNTLSVATCVNAVIRHSLAENEDVRSVNAVVGETNDGRVNDIRGLHGMNRAHG